MTEEEFLALPEGEGILTITFVLQLVPLVEYEGVRGPAFYAVIDGKRESVLMTEEAASDLVHALGGHFPECHH